MVEVAQRPLAAGVVTLEPGDHRLGLRAELAHGRKQVMILLGVVQALGVGFQVMQHQAEYLGVDRHLAREAVSREVTQAVEDGVD